jgi:hypothetical protein
MWSVVALPPVCARARVLVLSRPLFFQPPTSLSPPCAACALTAVFFLCVSERDIQRPSLPLTPLLAGHNNIYAPTFSLSTILFSFLCAFHTRARFSCPHPNLPIAKIRARALFPHTHTHTHDAHTHRAKADASPAPSSTPAAVFPLPRVRKKRARACKCRARGEAARRAPAGANAAHASAPGAKSSHHLSPPLNQNKHKPRARAHTHDLHTRPQPMWGLPVLLLLDEFL